MTKMRVTFTREGYVCLTSSVRVLNIYIFAGASIACGAESKEGRGVSLVCVCVCVETTPMGRLRPASTPGTRGSVWLMPSRRWVARLVQLLITSFGAHSLVHTRVRDATNTLAHAISSETMKKYKIHERRTELLSEIFGIKW